jgi:cytochrome c-type biogenesis protein CcmH/NrfG
LRTNPTNGEAQLNLGRALVDAGRHREAVKALQRAKNDPRSGNDIEAMSLLADCFDAGNLQDLAAAELEAAIEKIAADATRDTDQQWKELSS